MSALRVVHSVAAMGEVGDAELRKLANDAKRIRNLERSLRVAISKAQRDGLTVNVSWIGEQINFRDVVFRLSLPMGRTVPP